MPTRTAHAIWRGTLQQGRGEMSVESGAYRGEYSAGTRFGEEKGTNPEELIGAANAGCFSMAFSLLLEQAGYIAETIETDAAVTIDKSGDGYRITLVHLSVRARVPMVDAVQFRALAEQAKEGCPVSRALAGTTITLDAALL
ncbi:MAG TPA: OsmC family protein [Gammaproteobacteria bacterium]